MPELPEVETTCRGLAIQLVGRRIQKLTLNRSGLRFPFPEDMAKMVEGAQIRAVGRRAKYILISLDNDRTIILHLGMSGRMRRVDATAAVGKHDHLILTTDEKIEIRFTDPRRFGMADVIETEKLDRHALLKSIGPEPLDKAFRPPALSRVLAGKKTSIKAALLDQRVVAGLGNIYVSEALFYAGISPQRLSHSLTQQEIGKLVPAIKKVLKMSIAAGGSSLRDYVRADGRLGSFQNKFAVYDREGKPCPGCNCDLRKTGGVRQIAQNGRSTYYCPRKQA